MAQELTQELLQKLLDYNPNTGVFVWRISRVGVLKGTVAGSINKIDGYVKIVFNCKPYKAHRLAWFYVHGIMPPNQIDHINHNRSDNRLVNLRLATNQENCCNISKPINNTSGIIGVYWNKSTNKWRVKIEFNKKQIHIGYFTEFDEAVAARKEAETKLGFHPNHGK